MPHHVGNSKNHLRMCATEIRGNVKCWIAGNRQPMLQSLTAGTRSKNYGKSHNALEVLRKRKTTSAFGIWTGNTNCGRTNVDWGSSVHDTCVLSGLNQLWHWIWLSSRPQCCETSNNKMNERVQAQIFRETSCARENGVSRRDRKQQKLHGTSNSYNAIACLRRKIKHNNKVVYWNCVWQWQGIEEPKHNNTTGMQPRKQTGKQKDNKNNNSK